MQGVRRRKKRLSAVEWWSGGVLEGLYDSITPILQYSSVYALKEVTL
jgi:hypothetical protein